MKDFDHIVIGHGLAGATLAIELRRHGKSVCVVDRARRDSASRVAAGLMTPITGKRHALTPRWSEFWPVAAEFYSTMQRDLGRKFFRRIPMVRLFSDGEERAHFERRREYLSAWVSDTEPQIDTSEFAVPFGGFEMPQGGRLSSALFLDSACDMGHPHIARAEIGVDDIRVEPDRVVLLSLQISARRLTQCTGYPDPLTEHWFPQVVFEPAKGESLLLHIPSLHEHRAVHAHGLWLVPDTPHRYRLGATYERTVNPEPTAAGREDLLERLSRFLCADVTVERHVAGVRPIVDGRQPVVGTHARFPHLGIINGLGSKGALLAPCLAKMYAGFLENENAIDSEFDLSLRFGASDETSH